MLTVLRHHGPLTAGISLSITGVTWSAGSALQSLLAHRPMLLLRLGFGLLTAGLATTSVLVWVDAPTALGLTGWALAGLGIGMTSSTLSVLTMAASGVARGRGPPRHRACPLCSRSPAVMACGKVGT